MSSDNSKFLLELYDSLKNYTKPKVCILMIRPHFIKFKICSKNKYCCYEGYLSDCILINSEEKYNELIKQISKDKQFSYLVDFISKTKMSITFKGVFIGLVNDNNVFPIIIDNSDLSFEFLSQDNKVIFKNYI